LDSRTDKNGRWAQKLTLDQAAKKLRIKRESVYKRVQRGTLPYTKGSDGNVYVYLDRATFTEDSPENDAARNSEKRGCILRSSEARVAPHLKNFRKKDAHPP